MRQTKVMQILLYFACLTLGRSSSERIRRQIVFENEDSNPSSDCSTPTRGPGQCVPWTRCPVLRGINSWSRLQPYVCGFEGSQPSVCCPMVGEDLNRIQKDVVTTTRRASTSTTTRRSTTSEIRRSTTTTKRTTPTRGTTPTTTTRTTASTRRPRIDDTKPSFLPESCGNNPYPLKRVVGGKESEVGNWPWMAVVFVEKRGGTWSPDCGGALVTTRHVITAAHCVVSGRGSTLMSPRQLKVRLGAHNLREENEPGSIEVGVDAVRRHEQFDPRTYKNDIAVLRLSRDVEFTRRIRPVCLPYDILRNDNITSTVWVTGFGTTSFNGAASDVLMEVGFDVFDQETCRRAYERELNITDVYLCAGTADGSADSCQGDSGGPLVTIGKDSNFYLIGVVSFGKLCAQPGYPGVYTRVTKYLDWLRTNLAD